MPTIPVRDLAKGGIILDQHPTALPLPAFTDGRNVLFDQGKCMRAPIWRRVTDWSGLGGPYSATRFCIARTPPSGFDEVIVGHDDASLTRFATGSVSSCSEVGFTPRAFSDGLPWTGGFLGDVLYVNRPDGVPRSLLPGDTQFTALAHWDPTWRCRVLRTFKDSLVALGITAGSDSEPSTVKVSDIAFYQTVPGSWDATDPTKLAYESPLARLTGPILDGLALGDRFLIYTANQVVQMTASANFIYGFEDLPFGDGVLATNCVAAVDGLHYVFGSRDIYVTDGQTKKSLAEERVKRGIYARMNMSKRDRCFVQFMPVENAVMFAYVSNSPDAQFKLPFGCNEAAVYSRASDTWTFLDLPDVTSTAIATVATASTWATVPGTWGSVGGTWYGQDDGKDRHLVAVSPYLYEQPFPNNPVAMLVAYDFIDRGRLALTVADRGTAPSWVERVGVSLDITQGGSAPLVVTKLVRSLFPEIQATATTSPVKVYAAGTETPFLPAVYPATPVLFTPNVDYQIDAMVSGRFLASKWVFPDDCDTEFSGYDLDVISNGRR